MPPLPQSYEMDELRNRLRLMRIYMARLNNPALNDLDALLSVAEAELQRAISSNGATTAEELKAALQTRLMPPG
jgi:hypothetical protein